MKSLLSDEGVLERIVSLGKFRTSDEDGMTSGFITKHSTSLYMTVGIVL